MQHWRAMREECIGFSPVRLDYQGWRNVFVISVLGASLGLWQHGAGISAQTFRSMLGEMFGKAG
jgi:hypothetical protein